ncbi:MAG: hypothetical protein JWR69_4072 [Pedosphaera sp.]|nr:hypothetical protein [Pedosphaera sp.]
MTIQPTRGHLRLHLIFIYALCMFAATLGLSGCSAKSQDTNTRAKEENIPFICFQYIGASDHPVWPLIITDGESSKEKVVAQLQPLDFPERAGFIRLTNIEFEKCVTSLKQPLIDAAATESRDWGVFRVTLSAKGQPISKALVNTNVARVLKLFPKDVLRSSPTLQKELNGIETVLGKFKSSQ